MIKDLTLLQPYCENEMKKLKAISKSIFLRFNEPLTKADYDDFYSVANATLWQAYQAYDPDKGVCFDGFLHSCLQKKFRTELTNRHRHKRVLNQFAVSLDATNEDEERSLLDCVPSDFDTFEETLKRQDKGQYQSKVQQYLSKLSFKVVTMPPAAAQMMMKAIIFLLSVPISRKLQYSCSGDIGTLQNTL